MALSAGLFHWKDARKFRSLSGMPAESDWVLQGPYNWDRSLTRNSFIFELSRQVGVYAPRTQLIEVFVSQNDATITGGGKTAPP